MPAAMRPPLRFLRILLTAATALSLVLCVASVALWVRSHSLSDHYRSRWFTAAVPRGAIVLLWTDRGPSIGRTPWGYRSAPAFDDEALEAFPTQWFLLPGFGYLDTGPPKATRAYTVVRVRLWLVTAATAALPSLRLLAAVARRARRHPSGLCPACGYDLRATPDRCPECGHTTDA
jgi:kynurenine formamidase